MSNSSTAPSRSKDEASSDEGMIGASSEMSTMSTGRAEAVAAGSAPSWRCFFEGMTGCPLEEDTVMPPESELIC